MAYCRRPRLSMSPCWRDCWLNRWINKLARRAVVLMNLGGPDAPSAVRPFLYNLFSDPAIIGLPAWVPLPLASLIASRRAPVAMRSYAELGGASPLLANTKAQAEALQSELGG